MAEQYFASMIDPTRTLSFDTTALLTSSTINALHFPGLTTSGMSDSGGSRRTSFLLDGIGMCESMTESFCSTMGQDELLFINNSMTDNSKLEKKDSVTLRKRRSRKAQYDAAIDGASLDKIETVNIIDEQNEADDAWLYQVSTNGHKTDQATDNIFSWVHKEFKTNDIHANKHRLLCKLDDMSHARTIRSVSCHNFLDNQRPDSFKRSSTDQKVYSGTISTNYLLENILYLNEFHSSTISLDSTEKDNDQWELNQHDSFDDDIMFSSKPLTNGRLSSPLRAMTPLLYENGNNRVMSPVSSSPLRHTIAVTNGSGNHINNSGVTAVERSRDVSKEREREPLDYTDLEVMAKVQLENLRQAERQAPLSKRLGGSNASLASISSGTSVSMTNRTGNKPPVAPKSTITRNGVKPSSYHRSVTATNHDVPVAKESKSSVGSTTTTRASVLPPNSANNNRTRPPTARPIQAYRGSQTTFNNNNNNNNPKTQPAPSSVQRNGKKPVNNFGSTYSTKEFSTAENGLLNDVSNKPLTAQVGPQRRTILPQSSAEQIPQSSSSVDITTATIPRSSSSLSQGRKSGIPTVGKPQRSTTSTLTRPKTSNVISSSQSSDNMMVTRTVRAQGSVARPRISAATSSWNEGCY